MYVFAVYLIDKLGHSNDLMQDLFSTKAAAENFIAAHPKSIANLLYVEEHEVKDDRAKLAFNYKYNIDNHEYEVFLPGGDIFCHLSEADFDMFIVLCSRSGTYLLPKK